MKPPGFPPDDLYPYCDVPKEAPQGIQVPNVNGLPPRAGSPRCAPNGNGMTAFLLRPPPMPRPPGFATSTGRLLNRARVGENRLKNVTNDDNVPMAPAAKQGLFPSIDAQMPGRHGIGQLEPNPPSHPLPEKSMSYLERANLRPGQILPDMNKPKPKHLPDLVNIDDKYEAKIAQANAYKHPAMTSHPPAPPGGHLEKIPRTIAQTHCHKIEPLATHMNGQARARLPPVQESATIQTASIPKTAKSAHTLAGMPANLPAVTRASIVPKPPAIPRPPSGAKHKTRSRPGKQIDANILPDIGHDGRAGSQRRPSHF